MYECLDLFSEPTKVWFKHAFGKPTVAQSRAWPHIVAGENVLVVAPTGSGKTLAAFLAAIDGLIRSFKTGDASTSQDVRTGAACAGVPDAVHRSGTVTAGSARRRRVKVLYISPLKALGVDVENNLGCR
jgi:ATP-dependent helicase Lhr and Lhr-like helicase